MKRSLLAGIVFLLSVTSGWASGASVSISTSGGVTFPAANPSVQPVTPASNSLIATITITSPKNGDTWDLKIRGASSNFAGSSGAPISITNVQWSASAEVLDGKGNVTVGSGQNLNTSDFVVASGSTSNKSPFIVQVTFTFTITNSWTYDADTYLQNLVLTATAN